MKRKGIFLVSLNSKRLEEFLKNKESIELNDNIDKIDVFVFDVCETLNGIFFNERDIEQQYVIIENTISLVLEGLVNADSKNRKLIRFTQLQKEISPYMAAVYNEYYNNASFKRHCKSQIFQNLQPKLRDVKITNHKSDLLEILAPFLLAEIAFYLYAFHKEEYDIIYGLESEMNIIADIKNNKYPVFSGFINTKITHSRITDN